MRPGIRTFHLSIAAAFVLQGASASGQERNLFVDVPPSVAASDARATSQLDRIKKRGTVKEVRVVRIETMFLSDSKEPIRLNVFEGSAFPVVLRKIERRSPTDYSWIGAVTGDTPGTATFVVRDGRITGTIRPGNQIFMVEPLDDGLHAIIKIDPTKYPPDHPPKQESGGQIGPESGGAAVDTGSAVKTAEGTEAPAPAEAVPKTIDVIVAYTPAARAQHSDMAGLIQTAVDEANTAYDDSGARLRLRLAHRYETSYTESDWGTDLARFRGTRDKFMDEVHARRDKYSADVAVLIVDNSSACGLASTIDATTATQAFAAVHWDCATGYFSFAHEIGHLLGARHNPEADPSTTPYPYGHGFLNTGGGWRTIMAYDSANCSGGSCTRVQCWSTPLRNNPCAQNPTGGVAMGTAATHDNVRVLNSTGARVAAFRPVGPTPPKPKCKFGEKCCEPAPHGGCSLCIPKNRQCP